MCTALFGTAVPVSANQKTGSVNHVAEKTVIVILTVVITSDLAKLNTCIIIFFPMARQPLGGLGRLIF
jgi:hypothetical protein